MLYCGVALLITTAWGTGAVKASDWELLTPGKFTTENLNTIYGFAANDLYAASSKGTIFHFDGTNWKEMVTPVTCRINSIWGTDANNLYAVGGSILRFNGTYWETVDTGNEVDILYDIWGTAPDNMYAVGRFGTLLHYDGVTCTKIDTGITTTLTGIWGSGPSDIYVSSISGTILHYDGTAWTKKTIKGQYFNDVWGTAPDNVYAVSSSGAIYHFNGTTWRKKKSNTSKTLTNITGTDKNNIFVTAYAGTIVQYNGKKWTSKTLGNSISGIVALSPDEVFGAGLSGAVVKYDGKKWSSMFPGTFHTYSDVWGDGLGNVYFAPQSNQHNAKILHYNGIDWVEEGKGGSFGGLWGTSANSVYNVGENHTVRHSDGIEWTDIYSGKKKINLFSIWGSDNANVYTVGHSTRVRHYNGAEWNTIKIGSKKPLTDIWGTSATDVYVTNKIGQIFKYDGEKWKRVYSSSPRLPLHSIHGTDGQIFAVGTAGRILGYKDGTWNVMNSPSEDRLCGVWSSNPDNAYAVGDWGSILHYDGSAWKKVESGTTQDLYGIWGSNANDIYAVGYGGTILYFSGNTDVRANEDEQASGAKVKILDSARIEINQETLEAKHRTKHRKPVTGAREFIASISGNSKGTFHYNVKGISGPVSKLRLLKLLPDGTATEYGPYNPVATSYSPTGTWLIKNSAGVPIMETEELDSSRVYTVFFIIEDNSAYDINPTTGLIYDPVLLTEDTSPDSSDDDNHTSGSSGGWNLTKALDNPVYDATLFLILAILLFRLWRSRRKP